MNYGHPLFRKWQVSQKYFKMHPNLQGLAGFAFEAGPEKGKHMKTYDTPH